MARPLRIAIEDGWYHVMNRGIERRSIFRSPADSRHFLQLLAQLPTRFGLLIHCYALMPNHYHLLVQTPQANLSQAVQGSVLFSRAGSKTFWWLQTAITAKLAVTFI